MFESHFKDGLPPEQERLFEVGPPVERPAVRRDGEGLDDGWPPPVTGGLGRPGFRYEDVPAVFGARVGVGPLIAHPDTNLLIWMHENLDAVEAHLATFGGPYVKGPWTGTVDALRDLLAIWWWRDLRVRVDVAVALTDNDPRRPPTPARAAARRRSVAAWNEDFGIRGGFEVVLEDDGYRTVPLPTAPGGPTGDPRWPREHLDRRIARSALGAGCHVLLTEDKDILRSHQTMFSRGTAVLTPSRLLELLDDAGQLEPVRTSGDPVPDLQALATFYALRSPDEALAEELARPTR